MSFTSDQKLNIISQELKNPCCRRSCLFGMLLPKATVDENNVSISIDDSNVAAFFAKLVLEIYAQTPTVASPGGRRKKYTFHSHAAAKQVRLWDQVASENVFDFKCSACQNSFLKGIFLSCGRTTDPKKQYNVEFSVSERIEHVKKFCSEMYIPLKYAKRKNENILYIRRYEEVGDFFGRMGCMQLYVDVYNESQESSSRNKANRLTNCETSNIAKAVSASIKIIGIIERLDELNLLSSLPEELESTARLRLRYRDLSLSQLAQMAIPPISKSGLSHRLNKIEELSFSMLKKQ